MRSGISLKSSRKVEPIDSSHNQHDMESQPSVNDIAARSAKKGSSFGINRFDQMKINLSDEKNRSRNNESALKYEFNKKILNLERQVCLSTFLEREFTL